MKQKPRGCKELYIPWVCGQCGRKVECKPSTPTFRVIEKRKKVRA